MLEEACASRGVAQETRKDAAHTRRELPVKETMTGAELRKFWRAARGGRRVPGRGRRKGEQTRGVAKKSSVKKSEGAGGAERNAGDPDGQREARRRRRRRRRRRPRRPRGGSRRGAASGERGGFRARWISARRARVGIVVLSDARAGAVRSRSRSRRAAVACASPVSSRASSVSSSPPLIHRPGSALPGGAGEHGVDDGGSEHARSTLHRG